MLGVREEVDDLHAKRFVGGLSNSRSRASASDCKKVEQDRRPFSIRTSTAFLWSPRGRVDDRGLRAHGDERGSKVSTWPAKNFA